MIDSCAASRGEEERGELAAHGRCCCLVYARVTFAALMRRVFCTVRCLCELFNCSTLRAPANSSRTRACVATAVLQLGCGFGRALNRNFLHLQVSGAWRFSGSAGRRMQTAMAQDARPPGSPTHVVWLQRLSKRAKHLYTLAFLDTLASRLAFGFNRSGRAPHVLAAS